MLNKFFRVSVLFIVMIFLLLGCSGGNGDKGSSVSKGTLKTPVQNLNPNPSNSNFDVFVDLPLLLWPSFEYKRIARNHKTKVEHCLITESEGVEMNIGSKVEVLDEARCLYVWLNSVQGAPKKYSTGIMRIRVVETGEEGWTWSKAVDFKE